MDRDMSRAWRRIKKKRGWDDADGIASELMSVMTSLLGDPAPMAEETAAYFLGGGIDDEALYKSDEVLELFDGSWRPEGSILDNDDWDFLRDLVNVWAGELDMDVVTSVMRAVVDRGGFHG